LLKIGIIGAGAIGKFLLRELSSDPAFEISALAEIDAAHAHQVLDELKLSRDLLLPLESFPQDIDIFIEAASQAVAGHVARFALMRGKIAIIASIGGLGDLDEYADIAAESGGKLMLPSGALVGLDALKAIPHESITLVSLKSTKPARTLADAEYFRKNNINALELAESTMIFKGTAREAAAAFPKSANVAAALAHASIGLNRVQVEMWADPSTDKNRHAIRVESGHGVFITEVWNVPFEENPKTSKLAAYSILATARGLVKSISVGT
jgi:aspartate dehydrogenase